MNINYKLTNFILSLCDEELIDPILFSDIYKFIPRPWYIDISISIPIVYLPFTDKKYKYIFKNWEELLQI